MRVLLVGLGRIAWQLEKDRFRYHPCTHAGTLRALADETNLELVGVCDRNEDKLRSFRRWWKKPVEFATTDYRELFAAAPADLVIIAASLESHHDIALEAMRRGTPALLLEKPAGKNLREAKALHRLATKKDVKVWVNFERRYHPAYRRVLDFVRKEKLGPLRSVSGKVLTGPTPPGAHAGPLLHDAVHWIDLLLWYAGAPRGITARMFPARSSADLEDTAFVSFHYDDFEAVLESGGRRKWFEFNMQLDFENGRIIAGNEGHFLFKAGASKRYQRFRELLPLKHEVPSANAWLELYREIAREGKKARPRITANLDDALLGMDLIERCARKLKSPVKGKR